MSNLKFHILQLDIAWESPKENFKKIEPYLEKVKEGEILVLPETFATGFSMNPEAVKETMEGSIVQWMKKASKGRVICGSVFIEESQDVFNRFIWCEDGKVTYTYDKAHLFSLGNEDDYYVAGKQNVTIRYKGWNIRPFVCYDLRFPVWNRNVDDIDLYIYVANWPEVRRQAWQSLLEARAIENQVYVVASNCVGVDGTGVKTIGLSGVIDYLGNWTVQEQGEQTMVSTEVSKDELLEFRKSLPFLNDRDHFTIERS